MILAERGNVGMASEEISLSIFKLNNMRFPVAEKASEVIENNYCIPEGDDLEVCKTVSSEEAQTQRRLIHVDFSVLQSDDEDENDILKSEKATSKNLSEDKSNGENPYMRTAYDLATQCPSGRVSSRRHTIVVCESPDRGRGSQSNVYITRSPSPSSEELTNLGSTLPEMSWSRTSLQENLFQSKAWTQECLSLTLEEVVHIRSVLTKAELEALPVDGHVKEDVEKRKVCFLCLKTRFSIFGSWGQKCRLCNRTVCAKCYAKMRIPTEHFAHVPVVALSPSLLNSPDSDDSESFGKHRTLISRLRVPESRNSLGSAPSSPHLTRGKSVSAPGSRVESRMDDGDGPFHSFIASLHASTISDKREKMGRSKTLGRQESSAEKLKGLEMTVCLDCKGMVIQIIKSSRTNRTNTIRNLTLNLSPVY